MSLESIPKINHPDRQIFEHAYKTDNLILTTGLSIDARVRQLQAIARQQQSLRDVDFSYEIASMEQRARQTLEQVKQRGHGSWTEYFRLISQAAFIEQRVMIPVAYEHSRDYDMHRYLTNGMYGINGNILEQELMEYDTYHTEFEREQLRGAIHEQTIAALINRGDNKRHAGLPSATGDDLHNKIDIDYWRLLDRMPRHDHIRIQVKTRLRGPERNAAPVGGIVITAKDMSNEDFHAARMIVRELDNNLIYDPEHGVDERAELDALQLRVIELIDAKYDAVR